MIINAILIGSLAAITAVVVAIFATTLNKAKNGKKIFEGDIVHGYWNTKFLIFFDLCCLQFRAKLSDGTEKDIDYYGDSKKIEVIGNIYDSPELLRSENG